MLPFTVSILFGFYSRLLKTLTFVTSWKISFFFFFSFLKFILKFFFNMISTLEKQVYVLTLISVSPPSIEIVLFLVRNMQFLFFSWCLTEIQNFSWNRQWLCSAWLYVWNWKHDRCLDINSITVLNSLLFAKGLVEYSRLFMNL